MTEEEIVRMLDEMTEKGTSRMKVTVSDELEEGSTQKEYHHGRCDIGSPFANGTLVNFGDCGT